MEEEGKTVKITTKMIIGLLGAAALFLFVVETICLSFAVMEPVFYGIMNIFVLGFSITGFVWAYLRERKPSFEMWLNLVACLLPIIAIWGLF